MRPRLPHIALLCALAPAAAGGEPVGTGAPSATDDAPPADRTAPPAADPAARPAPPPEVAGEVIEIRARPARVGSVADLIGDDAASLDRSALQEAAFVSRVRLATRAGEQVGLAEVVSESVGVAVRALGGLGSFATLSVRGNAPGHTQVVVDGVPLSRLGAAATDLGRLGLGGYSTVELYRGGAPGHLGGSAGSALHLISQVGPAADGRRLRLTAGAGSFGARHLDARYLGGDDELGWLAQLAYGGARGDFAYFDDRGTNLTTSDDRTARRQNAGHDGVDAAARIRQGGRRSRAGGVRTAWRTQGVPGPANAQSSSASLTSFRQTADASLRTEAAADGRLAYGASVHALVEQQRYRDLAAEIGVGAQDRRYLTAGAGAVFGADGRVADGQRASATAELRAERFEETDLLGPVPRGAGGVRFGGAVELADEIAIGGARATLRPSVRLEWTRTRPPPDPDDGTGPSAPATRDDLVAAPRLGARVAIGEDAAIKASAARYLRLPTALELFGDRGVVIGNPALRAERGWSTELGVVLAPARRLAILDRVHLEAVLFATRSTDTIALVPTAALVVAPQNLGDARTLGAELTFATRLWSALGVVAHYTGMHTRQSDTMPSYEGKELPHRPRHRLYARAELAGRVAGHLVVGWTDLDLTAGSHLNPANLDRVPRRALVGAGGKVELVDGLLVGVELENLLDARVESIGLDPAPRPDLTRVPRAIADFYGYPLPGRALYLTIQWET